MLVEIQQVSKQYQKTGNSFAVLDNINLSINEGEFVSFLGPSGCGKSTLLNVIAGLDVPSGGIVRVGGEEVAAPGPDRVVVFQEAALFPWLNVLENVEFGLKMLKVSPKERRERAHQYLKLVHLSRFVNSYPHELSGGMRQRVAIARALAMDPKILLMDEPFAALDEQTRKLLHEELESIWQKTGKTIIFVTHNIREAVYLSDRIVVFATRPGRIKQEFRVPYSRPRLDGDTNLVHIENKIMDVLREEIEKVAREEIDSEYSVKKNDFLYDINRNMGSNI